MILSTIFADTVHSFEHLPKVEIKKERIRQFRIYLCMVFDHIYYGLVEWDVMVKLKGRHTIYINRLTQDNYICTKDIPFKQMIYVANVVGAHNLIDTTLFAEMHNRNVISHAGLRVFLKKQMQYEGYK